MFTDTPKLQPISKSRNNDKKVPSNNASQSNTGTGTSTSTGGGSNVAPTTANAFRNKPDHFKWVAKDYNSGDNRNNFGSYRNNNNYQNQKFPRKFNNRDFNDYNTNNFVQFNNFNSYKRWPDWDNTVENTSYNRRNSNYKKNNYNNNYKYFENSYVECESSFAEDSFECNNINKKISSKTKETDQINKTIQQTVKNTKQKPNTKSVVNEKSEHKNNQESDNQNKRALIKKNLVQKTKNSNQVCNKKTNCVKASSAVNSGKKSTSSSTEILPAPSIPKSTNVNDSEKPNFENNKDKTTKELSQKSIEQLDSNPLPLKESVKVLNLNVVALNEYTHTQAEQHTELSLSSCSQNVLNKTNFIASTTSTSANEVIQTHKKINDEPRTVLEDITSAAIQGTATTTSSPQPLNSFVTSDSESFDFHIPKISLIPISRLLATEFWESTAGNDNRIAENCPKHSSTPQKAVYKPNLIKRKRNASTCSNSSTSSQTNSTTDRIVEKLVTMNKINIKNIINSSETKYDEALKLQARKRLREEIRRQLKSMNIEPPRDSINTDFIPDEIVESIDIPDVVFDEIRRALGLELFPFPRDDNANHLEEIVATASAGDKISEASAAFGTTTTASSSTKLSSDNVMTATTAVDLIDLSQHQINTILPLPSPTSSRVKCEIKTEHILRNKHSERKSKTDHRSKSKKLTKRKESRKSKRYRSPKKPAEDVVFLISSSSSSSEYSSSSSPSSSSSTSSSSTSSSSDSESDVSKKSSTSSARRKRLKLKVDAENVVDSFEKLILSSLSESLRERYRTKYSTSVNTKLHFISCICTSDYNSGKFSKLQIAKVQKNLKSSDCSMALEFLMKEIVNVFNKQKQVAKMEDSNRTSRAPDNSPKKGSTKEASNRSVAKENSINGKSLPKPSSLYSDNVKTKSANDAEKSTGATNGEKHIQECVSKVLSLYRQKMKAAMQANETKNQPSPTQKSSTAIESEASNSQQQQHHQQQQTSTKSSSSNNLDKTAGNAKPNEDESHLQNPTNCINQQQEEQHQTIREESVATTTSKTTPTDTSKTVQTVQCNGTAEEKIPTTQIIPIHTFCTSDYSSNNPSSTLNDRLNSTLLGFSSSCFSQQPSFPTVDLEELKKHSPVGEVVVNNLREIDVKLMELHKRKMYLEEMILKLQKDKMEADLLTIKLQNEKFILLNTAMTANVTSTAIKNHNNHNASNENTLKQRATCSSSFENIKLEATNRFTKKSEVVVENKEEEQEIRKPKPLPANKPSTIKKPPITATKRKQPPHTATTNDVSKKCKPNKPTTASKSCPRQSGRSTKTTPKKSSDLTSQAASPKCAPLDASISTAKDCDAATTEKTVQSAAAAAAAAVAAAAIASEPSTSQEQFQPPVASEASDKPEDSDKNISIYKKMNSGNFEGIRNPITQIRVFEEFIIASSEDGKLYKFDVLTLKLLTEFPKHSEAITQMCLCRQTKTIFTTSLDGYLKKSSAEDFAVDMQSVYLQEPLQSIDIRWDIAYIGSRWGNIYTYNIATNCLAEKTLCSTDSSIISINAVEEGVRKILIVSSKGNLIHLRNAVSGILLRTLDVPEAINIYSILLNDGVVYCGTQKKEIRRYDFASGQYLGLMTCGNGAVSMQMYNNKYIFVGCYDGFIYILDKATCKQMGRLAGSGKMILTLEIIEDKIITSAKDNTMKVTNIPSYCLKSDTQ